MVVICFSMFAVELISLWCLNLENNFMKSAPTSIVNPAKPNLQSIIIEPHQSPHIKENTRFDIGIKSNRSSVIVRCQKPEPAIKSVPNFQDQVKTFNYNEGESSKSATDIIGTKDDALTLATDSISNIGIVLDQSNTS